MSTNRRRRGRGRSAMPAWAARLLQGIEPERGSEDYGMFLAWEYFAADVPGLPRSDSPAGRALLRRCGVYPRYTAEEIAQMPPAMRNGLPDYEGDDAALAAWIQEQGR